MNPGVLLVAGARVTAADHVIAIDVGTQSVRALVFDPTGSLIAMAKVPIEPYVSPQPGWAEQDPELYWRSIGEACRRVLADPAVRIEAIAGLDPDDPARHGRRDRRARHAAAAGDRVAGPAADGRTCRRSAGPMGLAVPGGRRPRHGRELRRGLRGELDPRQRARDWRAIRRYGCCRRS